MTMTTLSILAEPFALFQQAISQAFSDMEHRCRIDVQNAVADANECKRQRDRALTDLRLVRKEKDDALLETSDSKIRIAETNAALRNAESTINMQAEMIQQLKREVNQWRDQSNNWQDHFLKVEQDRCALSTRIDELVAETRTLNTRVVMTSSNPHASPITPSSTTTKRGSTHPKVPMNPGPSNEESEPTVMNTKKTKSKQPTRNNDESVFSPRPTKMQKLTAETHNIPPSNDNFPQSILLRRVQAVIHSTVKDEDDSEEEARYVVSNPAPSLSSPEEEHISKIVVKRKPLRMILQDDDNDFESEYEEPSASRRKPAIKKAPRDWNERDDEEEDDELMLGPEINQDDEIYRANVPIPTIFLSAHSEPSSVRHNARQGALATPLSTTSTKKRKLAPNRSEGKKGVGR